MPEKKLKVLVISTEGSDRQKLILDLFSQPTMVAQFEPPVFSPSVSSRSLRNRFEFFRIANECGLIPPLEWDALKAARDSSTAENLKLSQILKDIPITEGRKGSQSDLKMHYSQELWQKAKTINRGRSVLGCTFAHLIALKRFVTEKFDVMLEDNVRACPENCANLVREARLCSETLRAKNGIECHFRYLGWLGSTTNLDYLLQTHAHKRGSTHNRENQSLKTQETKLFPFPLQRHLEEDLEELNISRNVEDQAEDADVDKLSSTQHSTPGGNFVWGSYAYWISDKAYHGLLATLQKDVGALLWKGKRARFHSVKPIDKVLPRQIMRICGEDSVQISSCPAFFRAPMLTSKIHTKWDPEFCKSTEFQLEKSGSNWENLWLSDEERISVERRVETGKWSVSNPVEQIQHY